MLVITRKNGQKIMINDNIEITIVEAKNGVCKVAINADKDVKIYREEIYYQIKLGNLMGKDTTTSSVDSVANLIKDGTTLNRNIDVDKKSADELVVENNNKKSIRIVKNNKNDKS